MAFIGVFDELMRTVMPQVDAVLRAATSIINSVKLKKLFKVVFFVNIPNSRRQTLRVYRFSCGSFAD